MNYMKRYTKHVTRLISGHSKKLAYSDSPIHTGQTRHENAKDNIWREIYIGRFVDTDLRNRFDVQYVKIL